ncbi:zinc ribbon domain-containing protein [Kribbella sp. DT2]|uniref:zinc ribbon domain-containing protein n=1 Tax=Kribbella sp. DT2 TaxID=3393427 RepID=UPI003CECFC03
MPAVPPAPASKLVAPIVEGDGNQPVEVTPQAGRPRPVPVKRAAPTARPRPGELICAECGEGNSPARKFCRRCGHSLAEAEVVKLRWWRRLRRKPRTLAAGSRPRRPGDNKGRQAFQSTLRRARAAIGMLLLAFALLAGFYPPLRTMVVQQVSTVKQKVQGVAETALTPVRPVSVRGPQAGADHPAKAAFDTFTNTSWVVAWDKNKEPVLTVQLDHPVALRRVIVSNGDSKNYAASIRPSTLVFKYSNEKSDIVQLADQPGRQELTLANAIGVSSFTVTVINVYPAQDAKNLVLSEIELFGLG